MKLTVLLSLLIVCQTWAYDPMMPPGHHQSGTVNKSAVKKKSASKEFILRQIVIHNDRIRAVINGRVLNEGSIINGAKVISIESNKVVLTRATKKIILRLKPNVARIRR